MLYLKLIRPKQWIKNFAIFAAPFMKVSTEYGSFLFVFSQITYLLLAFLSMIFASSSIYIFNDICDIEKDKAHKKKCKRPIAAGLITVKNAYISSFILATSSVLIALPLGKYAIFFPFSYIFLMVIYTLYLKQIPYIDIFTILLGFFIRMTFGAYVSESKASLLFSIIFLSILSFIAFGKRYSEYINNLKEGTFLTRETLRKYNEKTLRFLLYVNLILSFVSYILWVIIDNKFYRTKIMFTFALLLLFIIISKYIKLIKNGQAEHPEQIFFHNKTIVFSSFGIMILSILNILFLR